MIKSLIPLFFLLLFINVAAFAQTKVDKSKSELKNNRNTAGNQHDNNGGSSCSSCDGCSPGFFSTDAIEGVFNFFYVCILGDYKEEQHLNSNLTPYPYYDSTSGNYEKPGLVTNASKYFRLDIDAKYLYSSKDLTGTHLKVKAHVSKYFYLQGDLFKFIERDKLTNNNSYLDFYNVNLGYNRVRLDYFNAGWTIGMCYFGNDVQRGNIQIGLNAELFVKPKLSFSTAYRWSWINNNNIREFDFSVRYHTRNLFLSAGYENFRIATPTYDFLSIGAGVYF